MDLSANNARDQCSIPTLNLEVMDPSPPLKEPVHNHGPMLKMQRKPPHF